MLCNIVLNFIGLPTNILWENPQSTYRGRDEIGGVYLGLSALSAGAYTATLDVVVIRLKGVGRAPPTLASQGCFLHHDEIYAINLSLPLCVYSVGEPER
jgi:hypothetical protein